MVAAVLTAYPEAQAPQQVAGRFARLPAGHDARPRAGVSAVCPDTEQGFHADDAVCELPRLLPAPLQNRMPSGYTQSGQNVLAYGHHSEISSMCKYATIKAFRPTLRMTVYSFPAFC